MSSEKRYGTRPISATAHVAYHRSFCRQKNSILGKQLWPTANFLSEPIRSITWQIPIDDSTPAFPLLSRYACMYFRKHWYNQTLICSLTGGWNFCKLALSDHRFLLCVSSPLIIIQASTPTYLNIYSYYYNSCEAWNINVVIVMLSRAPPGRT